MEEQNISFASDEDAVWLIRMVQRDIDAEDEALTRELAELERKLKNLENARRAKVKCEEIQQCKDRLRKIEFSMRKLAQKRQYFENMCR